MSFIGQQRIMMFPTQRGICSLPLSRIHFFKQDYVYPIRVLDNGRWKNIDLTMSQNKVNQKYVITTIHNKSIAVSRDHMHLTPDGLKRTDALTTNDFLQVNTSADMSNLFEQDDAAYQTGFTIGACFSIGDETHIEKAEDEATEEELEHGVTADIDYIEFKYNNKYTIEALLHLLCCGLLTMHSEAIETLRILVTPPNGEAFYLDDSPRGSKSIPDGSSVKIIFNSSSMNHSMGAYRQLKSFDWDSEYQYKRPPEGAIDALKSSGVINIVSNSYTDDGVEIAIPNEVLNCDIQQRLGLLDGLTIQCDSDNVIRTFYPHIVLSIESLATLLCRQTTIYKENVYGIYITVKKETMHHDSEHGGSDHSETVYTMTTSIELMSSVYCVAIFDMHNPKKLQETSTVQELTLSAAGPVIEDSKKKSSSSSSSSTTKINQEFEDVKNDEEEDSSTTYLAGVVTGKECTLLESSDQSGLHRKPTVNRVKVQSTGLSLADAIYGIDYIVKNGKAYFKIDSISLEPADDYEFSLQFDPSQSNNFTLQNGLVIPG